MPSFLLALLFLLYFCKHSFFAFVQASSISGDIVPYTAPVERRGDLDSNTNTWPSQALEGGDSPPLFSATINQKNGAALTAPNTNRNNFLSIPNNINNNDKPLLSEATTSETSLLLASNTDCRSSSTNDDSTTLESSQQQQQQQMAAGQQSLTEKRRIRGRRRRRRRLGEISVVPPPANACQAPLSLPLSPPPPSTPQPQNAQNSPSGQKTKKKKETTAPPNPNDPPPSDGNTDQQQPPPPPPSSADLNWGQDMYPSLFRIPIDGYTEGGYNPNCIMKTDGLLPLGVCDSGDDEDVQGSTRDFYGNHVDAGVFLDSVAFKLERCGLARTLANSCQQAKSKFWCCKEFEVVDGVGVADICLRLAAVEGKFYH